MKEIICILVIFVCLFSFPAAAQKGSAFCGEAYGASCTAIHLGSELDFFPYLTGGYYASLWAGAGHIRLRGVAAESNLPQMVIRDGFKDLHTAAYALIADYFFSGDFSGFWIAAGTEYWKNSVRNSDNGVAGNFSSIQLTFGGGYTWKVWKNFYFNPWAAVHIKASGSDKIIGGKSYRSNSLLPEASVKIGWYF